MPPDDVAPLLAADEAFERLLFPLQSVDRLRLLAVFVDRKHQAAVQQLLVDVDGRRGEKHHHRAFHAVLMRDQAPVAGSFPVEAIESVPSLCSSFSA